MHTLILGAGYSGFHIARKALRIGTVCGTRRTADRLIELTAQGIAGSLLDPGDASARGVPSKPVLPVASSTAGVDPRLLNCAAAASDDLFEHMDRATHLVVSVAPDRQLPLRDPMLDFLHCCERSGPILPALRWIGYLSTIGVYGDHQGAWVDEDTPCLSIQSRSQARLAAEQAWQSYGQVRGVPVSVLRLSGIYGPGRNAYLDALCGRARVLIKPDQVFNRIHVEDLAEGVLLAARQCHHGVVNITDDEPAPPQDVVRHAHALAGKTPPPAQDFATAEISPMARSFYSENKRVSNARSKDQLGLVYRFPTYRQGLMAIRDEFADAAGT